jgi:DNA-binding response OmpR family regulator
MDAKQSILIIDENSEGAALLTYLFRVRGWDARYLDNGPAGLLQSTQNEFTVILTNVALADTTGFEIAASVRAAYPNARPLLVGVVSHWDGNVHDQALATAFDFLMCKPFKFLDLLSRIEAGLHSLAIGGSK